MAGLDLEIRKASLIQSKGPNSINIGAVARLRQLGERGIQAKSIALGIETGPQRIDGLIAGAYEVELLLPSGRVLSQHVDVQTAGVKLVSFDIDSAPSDVLAWQDFAGQVTHDVSTRPSAPLKAAIDAGGFLGDTLPTFTGSATNDDVIGDVSLLMIEVQPTLEEKNVDPKRIRDVWRRLRCGVGNEIKPADMVRGFFKRVETPEDQDDFHDSWQFNFSSDYRAGKRPTRYYAVVRGTNLQEFVSLPLPWRIDLQEQGWLKDPVVDLLVDKSAGRDGARSSVVIRDSAYGGLISYMATGAIGLAGEMMRAAPELELVALDRLGEKSKSPLGACAAAYVLLATRDWTSAAQESELLWQQWVRNLEADPLYNWIPDAAILCARMVLQKANTKEEAREAIPYVHRALRNGLPFFALGYSWLLEAMAFLQSDRLIKSVYQDVQRVGRFVDTSQTFLSLQLDPPAS